MSALIVVATNMSRSLHKSGYWEALKDRVSDEAPRWQPCDWSRALGSRRLTASGLQDPKLAFCPPPQGPTRFFATLPFYRITVEELQALLIHCHFSEDLS